MELVFEIGILTFIGIVLAIAALFGVGLWLAHRCGARKGKLWQAALAKLPLGVAVFDADRNRLFANDQADQTLPAFEAPTLEQIQAAARTGLAQSTVVRGANGAIAQAYAAALDGGQTTVLLTLRDLSQQQHDEASYRKLVHTLSHELLTPLTAIQGHLAHLAASDQRDETAWIGSVRVARDEVDRLTRLTSNLLILARLESGQPLQRRPVNLIGLAEEVVLQLMGNADKRDMTLNIRAATGLPRHSLDRDAWKQVFLNLIDNAIKYGRDGGKVDVMLNIDDTALQIEVNDDGPGVELEDVPHLFDEFYRGDAQRRSGGSGLGLAIVKRIVERHGGAIRVESTPGSGAAFKIALPLNGRDVTNP